ncbi:MAG: indole-3-glycerol phosphate synthase TrpC [Chthoniobacterales bacterium]
MSTFLDQILSDVAHELSSTKARRPLAEVRSMLSDAPAPRDFHDALASSFGLIAEIKERSPSVGPMRTENVAEAAAAYEESSIVRALSILTNSHHFGMDIERLAAIRTRVTKPVLRKDFIVDEYQVREARAFGADAILLMANVLDAARMAGFHNLALELGMEVLFEVHSEDEIALLPPTARIVGINSRKFKSTAGFVGATGSSEKDFTLTFDAFDLVEKLPTGALRIAESGISPVNLALARDRFDAVLVGTSLLRDPAGIRACLAQFEGALHSNA